MYDIVRPYNRWDQNESKVGFFKAQKFDPHFGVLKLKCQVAPLEPKWLELDPKQKYHRVIQPWFMSFGLQVDNGNGRMLSATSMRFPEYLQCWVGKCNIAAVFSTNEKTVSFTKSCKNHALSMVFWGPRYVVLNSVALSTLAEVLSS